VARTLMQPNMWSAPSQIGSFEDKEIRTFLAKTQLNCALDGASKDASSSRLPSRMLKKHALSIAEGSASFVLAALGSSTYRTEYGAAFASPAFAEAASRLRAEALQRASAQAGRLLRPRWTAFLTILRAVLMPSLIS